MSRPKRSLGQNFLIDPNYQRKIITAVQKVHRGEMILEIGPGRGALTVPLAQFSQNLVLVEKDNEFSKQLKESYPQKSIQIFHEDFLEFDLEKLNQKKILVVGNLPYNISSQILIKLLKNRHLFSYLILMFQKEVALRCMAKSQTKDYSRFSVWAQYNADVKKICDVPPTAFRPRPKVVSTVLQFTLKPGQFTESDQRFFDFVKLLFSQRRKKIATILKQKGYTFQGLEGLCDKRVEALDLEQVKEIFREAKIEK